MKATLEELFREVLGGLALERVLPDRIRCEGGLFRVGGDEIRPLDYRRILIVGIGKAASQMSASMRELMLPLLGSELEASDILRGIVVGPSEAPDLGAGFECTVGGHPYPSAGSEEAAGAVLASLEDLGPRDLALFLISGGGSALLEKALEWTSSADAVRELHEVLVTCGAGIIEMNVLRKHLSAVKGGRLARAAHPARQLTLYISDVPEGCPSAVASGPTMPDDSTIEDCRRLLSELALEERLPRAAVEFLGSQECPETPDSGDPCFEHSSWHCLLSNADGVGDLMALASGKGWIVEEDLTVDDWPLEEAADNHHEHLGRMRRSHAGRTVALVSGGELSSPVTGDGIGGRNQAFVLACAGRIAGMDVAVLSAGTDGIDGNSPAAGAVADGATAERAAALGMDIADHLLRCDAHSFFEALGDAIRTGPTGNNVRDLRLLVAW